MTVAELIAKLQTFPPEQRVVVYDDGMEGDPNPQEILMHEHSECYGQKHCYPCSKGQAPQKAVSL